MEIKAYHPNDEKGWLQCRVLAFLSTAYYDNVLQEKEKYKHPSIELVAIHQSKVVGLIDVEYETEKNQVCTGERGLGGMIWHLAVHPDYQRLQIGQQLLHRVENLAIEKGLTYLEAWTRDDNWVVDWYKKNDFRPVYAYLHVFMEGKSEMQHVKSEIKALRPVQTWAHYNGENEEFIRQTFERVHTCTGLEKRLDDAKRL